MSSVTLYSSNSFCMSEDILAVETSWAKSEFSGSCLKRQGAQRLYWFSSVLMHIQELSHLQTFIKQLSPALYPAFPLNFSLAFIFYSVWWSLRLLSGGQSCLLLPKCCWLLCNWRWQQCEGPEKMNNSLYSFYYLPRDCFFVSSLLNGSGLIQGSKWKVFFSMEHILFWDNISL